MYVNHIIKYINPNYIKCIKMNTLLINKLTCDLISKFPLRKLNFINCGFYELNNSYLICNNLRFLKIVTAYNVTYGSLEKWTINGAMFKQCSKIRNLKLINCGTAINFYLKDFKYLRYYDFKGTSINPRRLSKHDNDIIASHVKIKEPT